MKVQLQLDGCIGEQMLLLPKELETKTREPKVTNDSIVTICPSASALTESNIFFQSRFTLANRVYQDT